MKRPHSFPRLALMTAVALVMTGCEWDNSDQYERDRQQQEQTDDSSNDTGGDSGSINAGMTISGVAATVEPIESAIVCLDENDNGLCDSGEPETTTDTNGEWTLTLEDSRPLISSTNVLIVNGSPRATLSDSNATVPWSFYLSSRVAPNRGNDIAGVFVSPVSTVIESERRNLISRNQSRATENIKSKLATNIDILGNYLSLAQNTGFEAAEYDRLERIAGMMDALATEIDAAIPNADRNRLSKQELNQRIFDQVNAALTKIVADVDQSLIEQPDSEQFDPVTVIQTPRYEEDREAPSTEPDTAGQTELERRIANATSNSPYFRESGFETFPEPNSRLLDFELIDNPRRPGQVYYEARRRIASSVDGDEIIMDMDIAVPKPSESNPDRSVFQIIDESDCSAFDCQTLRSRPLTVRALAWTGFSFRTETIQVGHKGRQRALPLDTLGNLIGSSSSNGFSSQMTFREFTLQGLDGREVVEALTGRALPGSGTFTFGAGALAYTFEESLVGDVILSQWPEGGTGNLCDSPGLPDASETGSCNLVYGRIGQSTGMPAQSFADALYPNSQRSRTYNTPLEDGEPVDALKITGPTNDVYVARLFGSATEDEGTILIDRQTDSGWETLDRIGRWERNASPFPRVELFLPSGFTYADARTGFQLGRAYLFERQGYLRHGWSIPEDTNMDTLFNRRQVKFAFSEEAFNQIVDGLEDTDVLVEHPYYSAIIDREKEQEENGGSGGGGQTE